MAKKRKASRPAAQATGPKELDPSDARLGPVSTFEDVANSEDEFFMNRDALMLDDGPDSKRRRKAKDEDEDKDLEFSDEEVLGLDDDQDESEQDEDEDEDEDEDDFQRPPPSKSKRSGKKDLSDDEEGGKHGEGEGEDSGWWGSSRKEYYDADNIETEADALEEEAEAKRLQKKKLAKMAEEDFIFDGDEWLAGEKEEQNSATAEAGPDGAETITEVLKEIEITDEMSTEERSRLLAARYPEFEYLVKDFQDLQPLLVDLKAEASASASVSTDGGPNTTSLATIKYWVLGCYIASLASYFAILTSPARDSAKEANPLAPTQLRDHDIMETLVRCRDAWNRIKDMRSTASRQPAALTMDIDSIPELSALSGEGQSAEVVKKKKTKAKAKKQQNKTSKKLEKAAAIEETLADLYDLPLSGKSKTKTKKSDKKNITATTVQDDGNSDFGEEDVLDARAAADKATRKKSLKFYTSQIVQKANRRAGAGRDAGGDMDIPHRERLRDRQARLLAEAEKRGKQGSKGGADLGDNSDDDEDDAAVAKAVRDEEDGYYNMVAHKAKANKEDKAARYAAYAAASKADRVVETEEIGEDGKRKINYVIEKNKGLTPRRSKDVRNPRVKRRKQFEAKQKKLKSMRPVWQGGEPKGGYRGELSGINAAVVKSTRL